ncbi:MAG: hypothetical protein ACLPND_15460 [Candidatus Korobacteraceae bacterium]|jgi:hypothetical protein
MDDAHKWGTELNSLRLLEAVLCADCEIISNSAGDRCEICGSPSLLSLGRVLGGSVEGQRAVLVQSDSNHVRNGFTVLVNPGATSILQQRRRRRG